MIHGYILYVYTLSVCIRKMDIPGMVEGYTVYGYMDIRHTDKKMDKCF